MRWARKGNGQFADSRRVQLFDRIVQGFVGVGKIVTVKISHKNPALILDIRPVAGGVAHGFAGFDRAGNLDSAREQQQLLGQL